MNTPNFFYKHASRLALLVVTLATFNAASAPATVLQALDSEPAATFSFETTRDILERASSMVFQGASAVQQMQAIKASQNSPSVLKDYMAAVVYVPQATALPTDDDVLDEPWLASTTGRLMQDGLLIPSFDTSPHDEQDGVDLDLPPSANKFLRLLKPVQNATISSNFGIRWGRPHQGVDLAAPTGTPIMAAETGKVVYSGWKSGYGNFVAIDHGHGYLTHYAHCSKLLVRTGQRVRKGEQIARVGSTGHSTGPHLHFEVIAQGVPRNPVKYINQTLSVVNARR